MAKNKIVYFCTVLMLQKIGVANLYPILVGINGFAKIGMFAVGLLIAGYLFYLIDILNIF